MKEIVHESKTFDKIDYSDKSLSGREFDDCLFKNCNFTNADFSNNDFISCKFDTCNLSMMKLNYTGMKKVDFVNCKVVGVDFSCCEDFGFSVNFEKCNLDYSFFLRKKMKQSAFENCIIREANFSRADLTNSKFDNCDLYRTIFNLTNLSGVDFRTATNYLINPEINTLKKAKFTHAGIHGLLSKYDIILE